QSGGHHAPLLRLAALVALGRRPAAQRPRRPAAGRGGRQRGRQLPAVGRCGAG
ncbi:unnamed protein product, partial [Prorocentrum cordatum]